MTRYEIDFAEMVEANPGRLSVEKFDEGLKFCDPENSEALIEVTYPADLLKRRLFDPDCNYGETVEPWYVVCGGCGGFFNPVMWDPDQRYCEACKYSIAFLQYWFAVAR